jgi:hypothetical protein
VDDAPFALSADLFVLHQAGIRQLLPEQPALQSGPAVIPRAVDSLLMVEPWATFLSKVPPNPCTVWTYKELGDDLTGNGNPARGALWREVIRLLDLPRGYVAFWPYCLRDDGGYTLQLDAFLEGLSNIAPKTLVVFDPVSDNPIPSAMSLAAHQSLRSIHVHSVPLLLDICESDFSFTRELAEKMRHFLRADF